MKLDLIRGKHAAACAAVGCGGGIIFLFVFPKGAITTLMHAVLDLPGPGAGIALILGPALNLTGFTAALLYRKTGAPLIASLAFAVSYALLVRLLEIPTSPKGAFGSLSFIAAVALFGLAAEAFMALGRTLKDHWRTMLAGGLANTVLLVSYWTIVFPRTAGWVNWRDVPLLTGLCLATGVLTGYIAMVVAKTLVRVFPHGKQEQNDVRSSRF